MNSTSIDRAAWRIADWCAATGLGRTTVFDLISAGRIKSIKIGARRLITTSPNEFILAAGAP
jgi:excisionase family DNA binding protein